MLLPEELGGACYFEPVTAELSDWMPTHEHFPVSKREGGLVAVDNAILAHRLCNRIDYSISVGRSYARDLERITKAREEATRRIRLRRRCLCLRLGLLDRLATMFKSGTSSPGPSSSRPSTSPKTTKKAPEWKSLPDAEKAQYLLDHQTLSDRTWTDELRLKGEKRDAFIRRILLGEVLHGEAVESDPGGHDDVNVSCEIEETELEGDYGMVASIHASCSRCGHETESFGTSERSIQRCLALMREECPAGESNFYVADAP